MTIITVIYRNKNKEFDENAKGYEYALFDGEDTPKVGDVIVFSEVEEKIYFNSPALKVVKVDTVKTFKGTLKRICWYPYE